MSTISFGKIKTGLILLQGNSAAQPAFTPPRAAITALAAVIAK
ncbi:MAG: hypothetical protein ACFCU1_04370 [Sumerlaeia bacterium]